MGNQSSVAAKPANGNPQQAANPLVSFMPLVVLILIFYVFLIRPQQKQAKEHRKMLDNLKNGDRVLTQGGIFGTVANLKGGIVSVKIAENVKVEVNRSSISKVIVETNGSAAPIGEPAK